MEEEEKIKGRIMERKEERKKEKEEGRKEEKEEGRNNRDAGRKKGGREK